MDLSHLPLRIDLQGAVNFRDMGGYPVGSGRKTSPGMLFRSERLSHLSEPDVDRLNELGIKTVVDFRGDVEREAAPDHIINETVNHIRLPLKARGADVMSLQEAIAAGTLSADDARHHLIEANAQFVESYSEVYSEFMSILLNPANYPLIFHCTAGKDRAGFAAASVLMNLGASKEVVMHDYLATDLFRRRNANHLLHNVASNISPDSLEAVKLLMQVHPDYIGSAFSHIDRLHGSIDSYLTNAQGMNSSNRGLLSEILCERVFAG